MNQTAHISLQILSISNSVETKTNRMRPNLLGAPRLQYLIFFFHLFASASPRRPVWRPLVHLCASGKGVLGLVPKTRKPFFHQTSSFLHFYDFPCKIRRLRCDYFNRPANSAILLLRCGTVQYQILSFPQAYPQDSATRPPIQQRLTLMNRLFLPESVRIRGICPVIPRLSRESPWHPGV